MNAHLVSLDGNPVTLPAAPAGVLRAVVELDNVAPADVTLADQVCAAILPLVGRPLTPAGLLNALMAAGLSSPKLATEAQIAAILEPLIGSHITYFTGLMAAMQIAAVLSSQPAG